MARMVRQLCIWKARIGRQGHAVVHGMGMRKAAVRVRLYAAAQAFSAPSRRITRGRQRPSAVPRALPHPERRDDPAALHAAGGGEHLPSRQCVRREEDDRQPDHRPGAASAPVHEGEAAGQRAPKVHLQREWRGSRHSREEPDAHPRLWPGRGVRDASGNHRARDLRLGDGDRGGRGEGVRTGHAGVRHPEQRRQDHTAAARAASGQHAGVHGVEERRQDHGGGGRLQVPGHHDEP